MKRTVKSNPENKNRSLYAKIKGCFMTLILGSYIVLVFFSPVWFLLLPWWIKWFK